MPILIPTDKTNSYRFMQMYKAYLEEMHKISPSIKGMPDDAIMAYISDKENYASYYITHNDRMVGFIVLNFDERQTFSGHDICIQDCYVQPEYRGKHIAYDAMEQILEKYPDRDFSTYILKNNGIAILFLDGLFVSNDYSDRAAVHKVETNKKPFTFRYWAPYKK